MYELILKHTINKFTRYFKVRTFAKAITAILFLCALALLGTGIFFFFREGFEYLQIDIYFGSAMIFYVYEIYLLVYMSLVVLNSFIVGLFSLFRGNQDSWVISSPGYPLVARAVFVQTFLSSFWPFFIIFLPFLLAAQKVFVLPLLGLVMIFISGLLLTLLITAITFVVIGVAGIALDQLSRINTRFQLFFRPFVFYMAAIIMLSIFFMWQHGLDIDIVSTFRAEDLTANEVGVEVVSQKFAYFPTHMMTIQMWAWQNQLPTEIGVSFAVLLVMSVVMASFFWLLAPHLLNVWKTFQQNKQRHESKHRLSNKRFTIYHNFSGGPLMALFKKEALLSVRDTRGLLWLGFLGAIWVLQMAVNIVLSRNIINYDLDISSITTIAQILQFVTTIYFISAFVMRFVFPSFSSEKSSGWVLSSAPIKKINIYRAKLWFYAASFLMIGLGVNFINAMILELPISLFAWSISLLTTATLFLVVMGLSLGSMFPNFETKDVSTLSTSMPGLGFIFLSLLYGAIGAWSLYAAIFKTNIWYAICFIALSFFTMFWFYRFAVPGKLSKIEFV